MKEESGSQESRKGEAPSMSSEAKKPATRALYSYVCKGCATPFQHKDRFREFCTKPCAVAWNKVNTQRGKRHVSRAFAGMKHPPRRLFGRGGPVEVVGNGRRS